MQESFFEFNKELSGFKFFSKKTGKQIYRFQMYWNGLTPYECFQKYDTKEIVKQHNI